MTGVTSPPNTCKCGITGVTSPPNTCKCCITGVTSPPNTCKCGVTGVTSPPNTCKCGITGVTSPPNTCKCGITGVTSPPNTCKCASWIELVAYGVRGGHSHYEAADLFGGLIVELFLAAGPGGRNSSQSSRQGSLTNSQSSHVSGTGPTAKRQIALKVPSAGSISRASSCNALHRAGSPFRGSGEPSTPWSRLDSRCESRVGRRKPWREKSRKLSSTRSCVDFVYEANLPADCDERTLRHRKYTTNVKYGNLYEIIRSEPETPADLELAPPPTTWLWEDEYFLWRREEEDKHTNKKDVSRKPRPRTCVSRSSRGRRPNADFYAYYNSFTLERGKKKESAVHIQKTFRGWLTRSRLQKLKKKALLEHGKPWQEFVDDYKKLVARIQSRYGQNKPDFVVDLQEMKDYMDRKHKYEKAFEYTSYNERLIKSDLPDFFEACELYPTEKEIEDAFYTVFQGSGNTADICFALDCSPSVIETEFSHLKNFLKRMVTTFDIGADRVRVAALPYSDDVFDAFDFTEHCNKKSLIDGIDKIQCRYGLSRTDIALQTMRDVFTSSRPRVMKLGVVVTNGRSVYPEKTATEARYAKQDGIYLSVIGIGDRVNYKELVAIASSDKSIYSVHDCASLLQVLHLVRRQTCLGR
ncbi:hypothetical protein ScPMuIL_010884 [Solemya velum]